MNTELSIQVKSQEEETALQEYKNLEELNQLPGLLEKGKAIVVSDPSQIESISSARQIRLSLKSIRTSIESKRKSLKEAIVLRGKAIDGMANIFKDMIVPVENYLADQEKYAERLEAKRLAELAATREAALAPYVQDLKCYDLKAMSEQGFNQLVQSSKMAYEAQREAERRAEEQRIAKEKEETDRRIAKEKADAEEREKIKAENDRLKQEQAARDKADAERKAKEDRQKKEEQEKRDAERKAAEEAEAKRKAEEQAKLDAERKAREKAEAEAKAVKEAQEQKEREEAERKAAEEQAARDAEEKARRAPDKEKLKKLSTDLILFNYPQVSSEFAHKAVGEVADVISKAASHLKEIVEQM